MEFHCRIQGDKTIQELGMDLQKLAQKAFPSMEGRVFDQMLKERFYWALHPRWQQKLSAPKPEGTFRQLFEGLECWSNMRGSSQPLQPAMEKRVLRKLTKPVVSLI